MVFRRGAGSVCGSIEGVVLRRCELLHVKGKAALSAVRRSRAASGGKAPYLAVDTVRRCNAQPGV